MRKTLSCPYFLKAFGFSVPIGALAGFIGLGGGEFRLPLLMHVIGFSARSAVPLNLLVSLVVLAFALPVRSYAVPISAVGSFLPAIAGLVCGGVASAIYGAHLVRRLSDTRLLTLIALLLGTLGVILLIEAFFPVQHGGWLPSDASLHFGVGVIIGLAVGLVSSVLGVAGGELLIPALVLVFGADIKTAGSASIVISLVIVTVGLWRHYTLGALALRRGEQRIASAMSAGSIVGAFLGALAVAFAPAEALKLVLGGVLIAAAVKTVKKRLK